MAFTTVKVIEILNPSRQSVPFNIKPKKDSPFFTKSGTIPLKSLASIVVELDRVDLIQLNSLQKKKLLKLEQSTKTVEILIPESTGTGSAE